MMDWRDLAKRWLLVVWHNPLLILGTLLLGGSTSFVYSYIPLQGGKNWEIDYLQSRVDAQNQELRALQIQLSTAHSDVASRPEVAAIDGVEKELKSTKGRLAKLESKSKSDDATIKSLRKTRDQWKKKYESAAKDRDRLASAVPAKPKPAPPVAAPAAPAPAPVAKPAPKFEPVAKPAPLPDGPATAEWDDPPANP